jgi:hypothetical protein
VVLRLLPAVVVALAASAASAHGATAAAPNCIVDAYLAAPKHVVVAGSCTASTNAITVALPSGARSGTLRLSAKGRQNACSALAGALTCTTRVPAGHAFRVDVTTARAGKVGQPIRFDARFAAGKPLTLRLELLRPPGGDND